METTIGIKDERQEIHAPSGSDVLVFPVLAVSGDVGGFGMAVGSRVDLDIGF